MLDTEREIITIESVRAFETNLTRSWILKSRIERRWQTGLRKKRDSGKEGEIVE